MADDLPLTNAELACARPGEIARLTWLTARMAKRAIAGEDVYMRDLQRKVDRVIEQIRSRAAKRR